MNDYQYEALTKGLDKVLEGQGDLSTRMAVVETLLTPNKGQPSRLDDLEERVSSLEKAKAWAMGAFAVVSSIMGLHIGTHKG